MTALLLLASLLAATSVPAAGAADGPDETPLALTGELVWEDGAGTSAAFGAASVAPEDVMIEVVVWPRDEVLAAMSPGDAVPVVFVDAALELEGDQFEVRLDPDEVPANYLNDDGRVTVELLVHAYGDELGGTIETVAAFEDAEGDTHWVDPLEVERLSEPTLDPADLVVTTEASVEPPESGFTEGDLMDCGSLKWVLETKKVYYTWIGNTYPVGGDTARMVYGSSNTASYGIAVTSGGGWSASGTKSITSGWSNSWTNSSSSRHYRVNAEYGRYRREWSRCGATGTKRWMVITETGGTGTASASVPNWTKCQNVSAATWSRDSSSGTAYSMSGGVQASSTIGIDLSIKSQYNSTGKLIYNVSSNKKMCGNGGGLARGRCTGPGEASLTSMPFTRDLCGPLGTGRDSRGAPPSGAPRFLVVVLLAIILAGCGDDVRSHMEGEGPLSVQNAGGGISLHRPGHVPWHGSFGSFHPCVTQPGAVVLDRVEAHVDPGAEPLDLQILHRAVLLEDTANHDGHISAIGVPPDVDHGRMRGEFTADIAGTEVSVPCSDVAREGVEVGELYFVVEVDERGARIESVTIHYHQPGREERYALEVAWEMVACGDAVDDDGTC